LLVGNDSSRISVELPSFITGASIGNERFGEAGLERGELSTLRGAVRLLSSQRAAITVCGNRICPHYQDQPLFHEVCVFLAAFGYTLFNLYELQVSDNRQLRYGDTLFLNKQMRTEIVTGFIKSVAFSARNNQSFSSTRSSKGNREIHPFLYLGPN
jgi:hypothetical protein